MLYPTLESNHYEELSKYRELLYDDLENIEYEVHVVGHNIAESPTEQFIEYTIVTEKSEESFTVKRRYSDFEWLMNHLYHKYPFLILPPIPSKRYISSIKKFSRPFIDKRQSALNVMVRRLSRMKDCMKDSETQIFLTKHQQEFDLYRKTHKNPSFFNLLKLSLRRFYNGSLMNIGSNDAWKDDATVAYMAVLNQRKIDRSLMMSILESFEWLQERWESYSYSFLWLAQACADLVLMMDKSELMVYIDGMAQLFFNLSTEGKIHYNFVSSTLEPIFKEYLSYNDNLIKTIKQRNKTKSIYHSKIKALKLLEARNGSGDFEDAPKGNSVDELTKTTIVLEEHLAQFDHTFPSSLSSWQRVRSRDLARCVDVIVTSNLRYHRSCLDLCTHVLSKIKSEC